MFNEKQLSAIQSHLTDTLWQCLDRDGMELPYILCLVSSEQSVIVARIDEGFELNLLALHEGERFSMPINALITGANNKAVRTVIAGDAQVGTFH